jgi:hypothetical protein
MTDRRKNARFDLRLPCEIVRAAKPNSTGETRNLSSTGVLLSFAGHLSVGEPIEYFITFPKPPGSQAEVRVRCSGKVLRLHGRSAFAASLESYRFIRESPGAGVRL